MTEDEKIQDIAVAMIRRASMDPEGWQFTVIGQLHPMLVGLLTLGSGELPLVSAFLSEDSWYAFTTRRIVSHHHGETRALVPANGIKSEFGNFKGYRGQPIQVATISSDSGKAIRFEYETGKASMAPIYATQYWWRKHPILHKLLSTAEWERHKARRRGDSQA
jgi:hypothetical protein